MASAASEITVARILELARQLTPEQRRTLLDRLLTERFETTLAESDQRRASQAEITDAEIQAEMDAVRSQRRRERDRAPGG